MANSNITDNSEQKELKKQEANAIFKNLKVTSTKLSLVALDTAENKDIASFIQQKLSSNNNLKLDVNFYNEGELKQVISSGNYNMYLKEYTVDQNNILAFLKQWSKDDRNVSGFRDSDYDKIIDKINSSNKKEEVNALFTQAEGILKERLPFIPLYFNNMIWCKSENVKELYIDGNGNIIFKYIKSEG